MTCFIRFYEELNFFLPLSRKKAEFQTVLYPGQSIKDLIESLGVPHTEVDLILINGESVDFTYHPQNLDRISVYPVFESLNIKNITRLHPEPLREIKFILDVHLGKLTKNLRLLGFDSLYKNSYRDREIAEISDYEKRVVLTRDRGLLKRKIITRGYIIRSENPPVQLSEVIKRFDLKSSVKPFTRCSSCNGLLLKVDKSNILDKLEPKTAKYFNEFSQCSECKKVYWKGSHYNNMLKRYAL